MTLKVRGKRQHGAVSVVVCALEARILAFLRACLSKWLIDFLVMTMTVCGFCLTSPAFTSQDLNVVTGHLLSPARARLGSFPQRLAVRQRERGWLYRQLHVMGIRSRES